MPGVEDFINKPLEIIHNLYSSSPDAFVISPEQCQKRAAEYFTKRIIQEGLTKIPSLNVRQSHELPPNSLVRFRCMIQDMYDPEYFMESYEVVHVPSQRRYMRTGMYKDFVECRADEEVNMDSPSNKTMDRLMFYTISVPGENDWIQKGYSAEIPVSTFPTTSSCEPRLKRSHSEDSIDTKIDAIEMDTDASNSNENKRTRVSDQSTSDAAASNTNVQPPPSLNLPIPESNGKACIVKIYQHQSVDSTSSVAMTCDDLKVNDVIEVVGILSVYPCLGNVRFNSDEFDFMRDDDTGEVQAHNPPASLVPRIHAIVIRKLDHVNPNLPWNIKSEENIAIQNQILSQAPQIRAELHSFLTQALMGDQLAAEYLLCHLISSIFARKDVVAVGKFCLNLSKVPTLENYTVKLYQLLSQIVTKSHWFPLSLSNLNTSCLIPKKDFELNRLQTGLLQLSAHTHFILDETALSEGRLEALGVKNMTSLGNLIQWQRVEYDFSFNRMEFSADMAVLVLSEGKSVLPSDCRVPLRISPNFGGPEKVFTELQLQVTEKWLESVRCYLTLLKLVNYSMSEELQRNVQEDFVKMRKENNKVSADDLHSLLLLARFISLSNGETTLSNDSWEKAKSLEKERKERLKVEVPSSSSS